MVHMKYQGGWETNLLVYLPRQAATEVSIRAQGQPFNTVWVRTCALKARERGRNAEEGTGPAFNMAWVD